MIVQAKKERVETAIQELDGFMSKALAADE